MTSLLAFLRWGGWGCGTGGSDTEMLYGAERGSRKGEDQEIFPWRSNFIPHF